MTTTVLEAHALLDTAGVPGGYTLTDRIGLLVAENARLNARLEAAAKRTDRGRLMSLLDEDRSEVLMMLADVCVDEGRPEEARGWGWLASAKKWPARRDAGWHWYHHSGPSASCHEIPFLLHDAMLASHPPNYGVLVHHFPSCSSALLAVVGVIASGAWSVDTK